MLKVLFFGRSKKEEVWEHDYILNDILDGREVSTSFLYLDDIRNGNYDFDVFIYSARDPNNYPWGYMPTFDDVLECVKKTNPRIVIQLSDEFWYEDLQIHNTIADHCELFLRKQHHKNYQYRINTVNIPLGYSSGYYVPKVVPKISERKLNWSYVGDMNKSDRKELYNNFTRMPEYKCENGISAERMSKIYSDTIFAPCGRGNASLNCMRLYESSMVGAIPIVVGSKEEIKDTFVFEENPPWLFFNSWQEAENKCQELLNDKIELQKIQDNVLYWWNNRLSRVKQKVNDFFDFYKLKDFPSVNCISITQSFDRRKIMYDNFKKYGIKRYTTHIYEKYDDSKHTIEHETLELNPPGRGPVTSHLKTIKSWYENTKEPYTIIFEDDIDFTTLKYWKFTWNEFFQRLPDDWNIVQLCIVRDEMYHFRFDDTVFKLRDRCFDDWSGCAYLISREHAKNLVENYIPEDIFYLEYKGRDRMARANQVYAYSWLLPQIENIIYTNFFGGVYCFPLFCENIDFDRTWISDPSYINIKSNMEINHWWSSQGRKYEIDQLFQKSK